METQQESESCNSKSQNNPFHRLSVYQLRVRDVLRNKIAKCGLEFFLKGGLSKPRLECRGPPKYVKARMVYRPYNRTTLPHQ